MYPEIERMGPIPVVDPRPWEKGFECTSEFPAYPYFAEYFEKQGYKTRINNKWSDILPKKFRKLLGVCGGDIDVIAKKDDEITVVEIKKFFSSDILRTAKTREKIADFIYLGFISSRRREPCPYGLLELHGSVFDDRAKLCSNAWWQTNKFYVVKTKESERFCPDSVVKKAILKRI